MSSVAFITSTQPTVSVTAGKSTVSQTAASQSQPAANSSSSVTISSLALYVNYANTIAEKTVGQNQTIAYALANPTTPQTAQNAYLIAHDTSMNGSPVGGVVSIAGKTPNDAISYANGEPVTVASQAYFTKQYAFYQNQALQLYNTENSNGTSPGQIIADLYSLQAKQPEAFRSIMGWTPLAGPTSIQDATNIPGTTPQYLNGAGQVAKT